MWTVTGEVSALQRVGTELYVGFVLFRFISQRLLLGNIYILRKIRIKLFFTFIYYLWQPPFIIIIIVYVSAKISKILSKKIYHLDNKAIYQIEILITDIYYFIDI